MNTNKLNNEQFYNFSREILEPAVCNKLNELFGNKLKFVMATDAEDMRYKFDIKIIYNDGTFKGIDVKTIEDKNLKGDETNFSLSLNTFYNYYDKNNFFIFVLPEYNKKKNYICYICNKTELKNICKLKNNKYYLCALKDIKVKAIKEFNLVIK
jgi:hypothetical protein